MLYRVETGPRAGLDDTQGRKTAQHLRKALNISVSGVRQIKVFTVDGLDAVVHVPEVRLTQRRPFLDDFPRRDILDMVKPSYFFIGSHCLHRPPFPFL